MSLDHIHTLPHGVKGVIYSETMTEGTLFWLHGKVGEGIYVSRDRQGELCSLPIPIVAGSMNGSGVGISSAKPLHMLVLNTQLDDDIKAGKRIESSAFKVRYANDGSTDDESDDIVVLEGLSSDDGFILNSRRRWISWLLNEPLDHSCQVIQISQ